MRKSFTTIMKFHTQETKKKSKKWVRVEKPQYQGLIMV